jgi:hypothetical protein
MDHPPSPGLDQMVAAPDDACDKVSTEHLPRTHTQDYGIEGSSCRPHSVAASDLRAMPTTQPTLEDIFPSLY